MLSSELRSKYLKFFESKGHLVHPSDSLVPNDPTLLFTSAGMVQFKPYYIGERVPPCSRIVTSQKCLRTDDVDEVGDAVHHTFFEMLGNFSFGDYFKRESIVWAWEFLTDVLKLNPDHIWTSVYLDDDEAWDIWAKDVGFPEERIVRLGEDKNYWPANAPSKGPNGVCGPCNEIFLDVTPQLGEPEDPTWSIAHDGGRFVEIWNLVFTQYDRQEDGTLKPLPTRNIDTGMGLERTIAVLQGTPTDYETDLFMPIIKSIESISGAAYGSAEDTDRAIRVVADHIRGAAFAIADGVMPSNAGRGYVLRRVIRKAIVQGRKLGLDRVFMDSVIPSIVAVMGGVYPEISERQAHLEKILSSEEEKFRRTLDAGLARLEEMIISAKAAESGRIDGETAFQLYDTFGFPLELTTEIAGEKGLRVDVEGFESAMEQQRQRAKDASDFGSVMVAGSGGVLAELERAVEPTQFVGYDTLSATATVQAILKGGELVGAISEGDEAEVVLDTSPFYAETGGQAGDIGSLVSEKASAEVTDTQKVSGLFFHKVALTYGTLTVGDAVNCSVNAARRHNIARNHSATHLLHAALRSVLGDHALQAGSVVDPDRLRFDFSHFQAVTPEELRSIEDMVNDMVLADLPAQTVETSVEEAREMGATALFGEKYGDRVRVVKMGDCSVELCGGTHLGRTSQIGLFKLVSESSIGAGLRRVEAVTGHAALKYVHEAEDRLHETAHALGSSVVEVVSAAERAVQSAKDAQREIDKLKSRDAADRAGSLAEAAEDLGGVRLVTASLDTADLPTLQKLADGIADKLGSGVVVLAGVADGKVLFVSKVTSDLTAQGFHAGNTLREVAKIAGGGGGGKPEFAQAGGRDASKVSDALAKACEIVRAQAEARL